MLAALSSPRFDRASLVTRSISKAFLEGETMSIKLKSFICGLFMIFLWSGCTIPPQDSERAKGSLLIFYDYLSAGNYANAVELYGGSYETLISLNPELSPNDSVSLWKNGCQVNGFHCLSIRSATLKEQMGSAFVFTVEFNNPDGSLFMRGPCCGTESTTDPLVSQFDFLVVIVGNAYKIQNLPVYVP
jgi:hypothetical protein